MPQQRRPAGGAYRGGYGGGAPRQGAPAGKNPYQMQPGKMYPGGSANFNEGTGQYRGAPPARKPGGDYGFEPWLGGGGGGGRYTQPVMPQKPGGIQGPGGWRDIPQYGGGGGGRYTQPVMPQKPLPPRPKGYFGGGSEGMAQRQAYQQQRADSMMPGQMPQHLMRMIQMQQRQRQLQQAAMMRMMSQQQQQQGMGGGYF